MTGGGAKIGAVVALFALSLTSAAASLADDVTVAPPSLRFALSLERRPLPPRTPAPTALTLQVHSSLDAQRPQLRQVRLRLDPRVRVSRDRLSTCTWQQAQAGAAECRSAGIGSGYLRVESESGGSEAFRLRLVATAFASHSVKGLLVPLTGTGQPAPSATLGTLSISRSKLSAGFATRGDLILPSLDGRLFRSLGVRVRKGLKAPCPNGRLDASIMSLGFSDGAFLGHREPFATPCS